MCKNIDCIHQQSVQIHLPFFLPPFTSPGSILTPMKLSNNHWPTFTCSHTLWCHTNAIWTRQNLQKSKTLLLSVSRIWQITKFLFKPDFLILTKCFWEELVLESFRRKPLYVDVRIRREVATFHELQKIFFFKWQPCHFSAMVFWLFSTIYPGISHCLLWFLLVFLSPISTYSFLLSGMA